MTEKLYIKILDSHTIYPNDGYRSLCAAVILQAWDDSFKSRFEGIKRKSARALMAHQARAFLTGNYSRALFKFYCEALGIDPNYIIKLAMKNYWSKDYEPKYFKGG